MELDDARHESPITNQSHNNSSGEKMSNASFTVHNQSVPSLNFGFVEALPSWTLVLSPLHSCIRDISTIEY